MKLLINRKRWLRGEKWDSMLYRTSDKKMCCLGFLARQCDIGLNNIKNLAAPEDLDIKDTKKFPNGLLLKKSGRDSKLCRSLILVNDSWFLKESEREEKLKKLFKRINIDVEFK